MKNYKLQLDKMKVQANEPVHYELTTLEGESLSMNDFIGKQLTVVYQNEIRCSACDRVTKKSFNQGYCYPCFKALARCDMCIMKPETCHYHMGTCREPEWADTFCMNTHYVYLSNASGLKVGITRENQIPTRWIDQGAIQAVPLYKVKSRYQAGLIEVCLGQELKDKTNWRAMLKGEVESLYLDELREQVQERFAEQVEQISERFGKDSCELVTENSREFIYPVEKWPTKISSYNLDKQAEFTDTLQGIKGQYLIFDEGVINVRKFSSYLIDLSIL